MNEAFPKATILELPDMVNYSIGGVVSKQVLKREKGNITLFSFDKEQGLSEHSAPFDAFVQILEGEAEIRIDKQPVKLKAGESIIMPANIPHAIYATEQFKMLLTMIKE